MTEQSKLDMINTCLLTIGEVPLLDGTAVDILPDGTDANTAKRIIEKVMVDVQARGWYFNMDYSLDLYPDIEGFITMPPNTLRVDFGNTEYRHRYVMREKRIYDLKEKTFFISEPLVADVVWEVEYDELSIAAYTYISLRSARKFQTSVIGSVEIDGYAARDEQDALVQLQREQLQVMDFKIQNHRVNTRMHNGYLNRGLYGNTGRRDY